MLKFALVAGLLGMTLTLMPSCGGDDEGDSSGGSDCRREYGCINGACVCTSGPKKDQSCGDPEDSSCTTNKCTSYCEFCS